ncbi:MAG: arsenate reductase ArsC [Campylobacterales bacterium]
MNKAKVLFVCIHNSARSQMAEAFLNEIAGDAFEADSAGFEPGSINPLAIAVMEEVGIDISKNSTNSVFEFFKEGKRYNYIITVCDEGNAERCPIFPGVTHRIHWSFKDPASLEGDYEVKLSATRAVRDSIKEHVEEFVKLVESGKLKENAPSNWGFKS